MKKRMLVAVIIIFCAVLALLLVFYFLLSRPNPELYGSAVTIRNQTFAVEVADTMLTRARGLSGRPSLGAERGMYFIFSSPSTTGFWMKDMLFPIDIVWIRDGRVLGFAENARPEPGIVALAVYYPPEPADHVLEINAGLVKQYGFAVGDEVTFTTAPENHR